MIAGNPPASREYAASYSLDALMAGTAGGFGTITAAYDPRQVQLGVKLLW